MTVNSSESRLNLLLADIVGGHEIQFKFNVNPKEQ